MLPTQPRTRRATLDLKHPQMPALSDAFDTPEDAARYAHEKIGQRREREYGGLILKRSDGKYVATEPLPGKAFEFDPNDVFPRNDAEGYVLYPDAHDDYAVYHSHPSSLAGLRTWPARERAIYQNAFSTDDIFAVIDEQEYSQASYLSAPDGSLIKYTVSDSPAEKELLSLVSRSSQRSEALSNEGMSYLFQALASGAILPGDFVRMIAQAGDLEVIIGSALWGMPGKVLPDWKPYPMKTPALRTCASVWPPKPVVLSAEFASADAAARYVHRQIGQRPHGEIFGFVLKNSVSGSFRAAEPLVNGEAVSASCSVFHPDAYYRPMLPEGWKIDGLYFSPARDASSRDLQLLNSFFQPADLHRMFEYQYVPPKRSKGMPVRYGFAFSEVYLCAADGALLGYTPSKTAAEYELARRVSVIYSKYESIQYQLAMGMIKPMAFIHQVANAGRVRVLIASHNWPEEGDVHA